MSLTILPITMITANGIKAFQGILTCAWGATSNYNSLHNEPDQGIAFRVVATEDGDGKSASKEFKTSPDGKRNDDSMLKYGVYDPHGTFDQDFGLKLRHVYVSWASFEVGKLKTILTSLENNGFEVLLTIEPWPKKGAQSELLSSIVAGEYDAVINQLAAVLSGLKGPVYVSWGHEMDQDLTERYPWSGLNPNQFVSAYRYVIDRFRTQCSTELRWIF